MEQELNEEGKRVLPDFVDTPTTPKWIREFVYGDFPITTEAETLGLTAPWHGFCFAHPPHDEAELWCEKAASEADKGVFSVLLLPAVFNSLYWKQYVYPFATEIRMIACPIKKPGARKQIVSQMALVIFAGREGEEKYPPIFVVEPENWRQNYYKRARNLARFSPKQ